jgi:hypothetical protein
MAFDEAIRRNLYLPIGSYAIETTRIVLRHIIALRPDSGDLVCLLIDRLGREAIHKQVESALSPPDIEAFTRLFPID